MVVVFHDIRKDFPYPRWTVERTIRHIEGNLYETEIKEFSPANSDGRILCGAPSKFTLTDGVARWVSNDAVLMEDVVRDHGIDRLPNFVKSVHESAYEVYLTNALNSYRQAQENLGPYSGEEMAEMRAAFGAGTVVRDVITGRRTRL